MASEAAQLLDQLMGATRNAVPGEDVKEISWSDEEVCKNYLCGFCPSELFINTKAEATVGKLILRPFGKAIMIFGVIYRSLL